MYVECEVECNILKTENDKISSIKINDKKVEQKVNSFEGPLSTECE